jgi:hypothetical protein
VVCCSDFLETVKDSSVWGKTVFKAELLDKHSKRMMWLGVAASGIHLLDFLSFSTQRAIPYSRLLHFGNSGGGDSSTWSTGSIIPRYFSRAILADFGQVNSDWLLGPSSEVIHR